MTEQGHKAVHADTPAGGTSPKPDGAASAAASAAELRTFLIADIRGYTTYTREHGDEAAAALAGQFADIVRAAVTARDGVLVELRGDEALVVFVSARQALRAAIDLQARTRDAGLPRGIGIGLDVGEAVVVDGGFRGTALNLAARLCGRAGPGEVLASESVIHMAAHVDGIAYVEPRSIRFKGFEDPIRTVKVVAEADVPAGPIRSVGRATRAFRGGRRPVVGAAVGAIALVVIVALAGMNVLGGAAPSPPPTSPGAGGVAGSLEPGSSPTGAAPASAPAVPSGSASLPAPSPSASAKPDPLATTTLPVLAFLDPATGEVMDTRPLANLTDISTFFEGSFWILGLKPKVLYRIDPTSHDIKTVDIPIEHEIAYAFVDGHVWISDADQPRVVGIDQRTGAKDWDHRLIDDPADTDGITGLAVGAGSIWAARQDRGEILRVDQATGRLQHTIKMDHPEVLDFGNGALWVTGDGKLTRIDPVTNEPTLSPTLAEFQFLPFIAFDGSAAWTASQSQGLVFRVARDGSVKTFQTGRGAGALAFQNGTMWVDNRDAGSISGIDVNTGTLRTLQLGHAARSIAAGSGQLMVAVDRTPDEEIAQLGPRVLTVATIRDPLHVPNPDPAVNGFYDFRTLMLATCASLMRYPDDAGQDGRELIPEVAASPPTVSKDGLTYTFKIRNGFAFSPPSNEPLTAETFRFSIERALSGKLGEPPFVRGIQFLDTVLGAHEFHEGKADHVAGLTASGDTLTIQLQAPDPILLDHLSYPIFCPVPIGTPAVDGGVAPEPPLPSAGPYYIAKDLDGLAVLLKNPNYHGDRQQAFDAIAVLTNLDPGEVVARVDRGDADIGTTTNDATLGPSGPIAQQWGPGSAAAAAGDQRFILGSLPGVDYISVNTQHGIFADPTIRRAASLALDRAEIGLVFPEPPVDHLLARSDASVDPKSVVPGPQLDQARALMRGRRGTTVFGVNANCGLCKTVANTVRSDLARIGITVKIQEEDDEGAAARARGSKIEMLYLYSQTLIVDEPGLLQLIVGQETPRSWLPKDILTRIDAILGESGPQRSLDAEAVAKRLETDEMLVWPFGGAFDTAYLSPRISCAFIQPAWYKIDLVAVCPKDG